MKKLETVASIFSILTLFLVFSDSLRLFWQIALVLIAMLLWLTFSIVYFINTKLEIN